MNKVYACTDLHGIYPLWEQIKEYCDETDIIYFLGDAIDRGDKGMLILRQMLVDKRVKFIKGNHEYFVEDVGADLAEGRSTSIDLWRMNGGWDSIKDFLKMSEESQILLIRQIMKLPTSATYINKKGQQILLSHAGYSPDNFPKELHDLMWDRDHVADEWDFKKYPNTYIVHGHTPVPHLGLKIREPVGFDNKGFPEPLFYADGHKIDLDLMSFNTGKAVLFDLDELKVAKTFYAPEVWRLVD